MHVENLPEHAHILPGIREGYLKKNCNINVNAKTDKTVKIK